MQKKCFNVDDHLDLVFPCCQFLLKSSEVISVGTSESTYEGETVVISGEIAQ